ncbi:MAG: Xaa-Pro aminopeptidase [Paraglaciecola sp.]|jgi:Xaa-Pro aminopeptidase
MIELSEFSSRRKKLLAAMQANSICVVPAAHLVTRSRDTEYPFRQDSYFHYLSGFPEPEAWLVLSNKRAQQPESKGLSILFCLDKDPSAEIWHGRRCGPEIAKDKFGLDMTFSLDDLDEKLTELVDGHQNLYFAQGHSADADAQVFSILEELRGAPKQSKTAPGNIVDVRPILDEMRLYKSPAEAALMRVAATISCAAHIRAMQFSQAGKFEYQLQAEIQHEFALQGAKDPAYGSIVGSGHNACILHYTENSDELKNGDLVLIDAGCELQGYAADITRTFPVSGRFSTAQKQLYQLVLDSQLAAFELIKPGSNIKLASDRAIEVITEGLIELGILQGDLADNITQQKYREFFMHGLSHWLGLDVHDVGNYKIDGRERPFEAGMVLTVEPGIYIAPDAQVDKRWRGIGIRIEDDLLITETGHENLTEAAPKHLDDIEKLMNIDQRRVVNN